MFSFRAFYKQVKIRLDRTQPFKKGGVRIGRIFYCHFLSVCYNKVVSFLRVS